MATQCCLNSEDVWDEMKRTERHKIRPVSLKSKREKNLSKQVHKLQEENCDLKDKWWQLQQLQKEMGGKEEKIEKCNSANRDLKRTNRQLQKQVTEKRLECSRLQDKLTTAEGISSGLYKEIEAARTQYHTQCELRQALEEQVDILNDKYRECLQLVREINEDREFNEALKMLLVVERTPRKNQDKQIASLMLQNVRLEDESDLLLSASVNQKQSMLAEVKKLMKMKNGLQGQLQQALNKLHIQAKEHLEMMQRQQMEQRMRKLKKANKSKAKRRRRKRRNAGATGELAEGTGDVQPRCDAKAAPSDVREKSNDAALEGEDEGVSMDTSEPTSTAEGEEQCKEMDAAAKHLLRMETAVVLSELNDIAGSFTEFASCSRLEDDGHCIACSHETPSLTHQRIGFAK